MSVYVNLCLIYWQRHSWILPSCALVPSSFRASFLSVSHINTAKQWASLSVSAGCCSVLSQFPVSWSCWQSRVGRLPFLEGPDASCNDPPLPLSTGLWNVLRVSFHITPSVQEAIVETRRFCHRIDHTCFLCLRLVLFYQNHLYIFMFFVLPTTVHFWLYIFILFLFGVVPLIWKSVSSLKLQVGRTTSTMVYTPSLSIFSAFLHHRHPPPPPLLPPLSLSLQPPRPASECTGESRQLRTTESEVGVDHWRACLEVCVFCEREEE